MKIQRWRPRQLHILAYRMFIQKIVGHLPKLS